MTKGSHNSVLSTCDKGDNIGRRDWKEHDTSLWDDEMFYMVIRVMDI